MKKEVAFCKECNCYTECLNLGKRKMTKEEIREKVGMGIFTLGMFTIVGLLCGNGEKHPTFYKCIKCSNIFEE